MKTPKVHMECGPWDALCGSIYGGFTRGQKKTNAWKKVTCKNCLKMRRKP